MELISGHRFWWIIQWPFWIATLTLFTFYFFKIVYFTYLFFKNGFGRKMVTVTAEPILGWERLRYLLKYLPRLAFVRSDGPGYIFHMPDNPIDDAIRKDPEILERWIKENPQRINPILGAGPGDMIVPCESCGNYTVRPNPEGGDGILWKAQVSSTESSSSQRDTRTILDRPRALVRWTRNRFFGRTGG